MEVQPNAQLEAWVDKLYDESDQEVIRILSKYLNKENQQ